MDPQIKKRTFDTVEYFRAIAKDDYGDYTHAPPVTMQCFQEERLSTVKDKDGEERLSTVTLYFDGRIKFQPGADKFKLEGDDREYLVLAASRYRGLKPGTGTTVVYL